MNHLTKELLQKKTPVYVEKFKLSHHPFTSQFNSTLFYENEGRKIILKKVAHLLDFTKLILFLQGAKGLGKSTLVRQRLRQTKKNWRICFINAKDITTPQALMSKIATDMELKVNREIHAQSLQEQLQVMHQSGLNPILLIDDVEQLNNSLIPTLASLIQHSQHSQPNIRLIISGQDLPPTLYSIIPKDNENSMLKYIPLPPLTEKETTEYIKHRLQASGYEYLEPFNKLQLNKIYLDAKGFPIYINQLADQLFTQYALDYENKKPMLNFNENTNKILKIVAGSLSSLVLIFILFSFFDSQTSVTELSDVDLEIQKLEIPIVSEANHEKLASAPIQAKPTIIEQAATPVPVVRHEKKPTEEEKVVVILKPKKTLNNITTEEKPKSVKPESSAKNAAWIKAQNPKHYTLQLIGSSSLAAAQEFIEKHKLSNDAAIVHSLRNGKDWYSVIYKSFKSAKEANDESKLLPKSLRRIKPWTRSFFIIQKSII